MAEPWIATAPIKLDGELAFDVGHEVPEHHVEKYPEIRGKVRRASAKAAQEAQQPSA